MINETTIKIHKLDEKAVIPSYGTDFSAGADLYAMLDGETIEIAPAETRLIHTGISMEIPEGLVGLVYARSGLASKRSLAPANKVGVIDSDYRGEVMVALHNHSTAPQAISNGERIAQIVFTPYYKGIFVESDKLEDSERGAGGFGSTGKN